MHRSASSIIAATLGAVALSACVTINIYFPAAAAERAADRIIDEVWQLQPDGKTQPGAAKTPNPDAAKPQGAKPAAPQ